jgi:hypothetical protein
MYTCVCVVHVHVAHVCTTHTHEASHNFAYFTVPRYTKTLYLGNLYAMDTKYGVALLM